MNLVNGRKVTAAKETATAISEKSERAKQVTIEALSTNTGGITIGGSKVKGKAAERNGITLGAGDTFTIEEGVDLNSVFIDSEVLGEGVAWTGVQS